MAGSLLQNHIMSDQTDLPIQLFLNVKLKKQFVLKIESLNANVGLSLGFAVWPWWCHWPSLNFSGAGETDFIWAPGKRKPSQRGFSITVIFSSKGRQDWSRKVEVISWKGRESSSSILQKLCEGVGHICSKPATSLGSRRKNCFALRSWHTETGLKTFCETTH